MTDDPLAALERAECLNGWSGWRDRALALIALERLGPADPLPPARVETPAEELERLAYRALELAGRCRAAEARAA